MPQAAPTALIEALAAAWQTGTRTAASPWGGALVDAEAAYALQDELGAALGWWADPTAPRAWKSGGGSRKLTLTHAALPPHGVRASGADFSDLKLNSRGIEAEIALRLAHDITPERAAALGHDSPALLVDAMTVSIEIVDSRWVEASQAAPLLRLADLQSHGALALGRWVPFLPRHWSSQRCTVQIGNGETQAFTGTHTLADPSWLLPLWLRHVTRHGATVPAGSVVTTGSWCGLLQAEAGDAVSVAFDGIGETSLKL